MQAIQTMLIFRRGEQSRRRDYIRMNLEFSPHVVSCGRRAPAMLADGRRPSGCRIGPDDGALYGRLRRTEPAAFSTS